MIAVALSRDGFSCLAAEDGVPGFNDAVYYTIGCDTVSVAIMRLLVGLTIAMTISGALGVALVVYRVKQAVAQMTAPPPLPCSYLSTSKREPELHDPETPKVWSVVL